VPRRLTPTASTYQGKACEGVQLIVDDWATFAPVRTGLALACTLRRLYPDDWQSERYDTLLVNKATWDGLRRGATCQELEKGWQAELQRFRERRQTHLLYPE
jgi:uncharacterized protein YbbC (DUF1343 family)